MELRTTREMRRNERLARAMTKEKKVEGAAAPAQSQPARQPADKLTLSRQALNYLEAMRRENPDPEDCESVLDEEDRAGASGGGYGEDAASIEGVFGGGEAAAEGEPA